METIFALESLIMALLFLGGYMITWINPGKVNGLRFPVRFICLFSFFYFVAGSYPLIGEDKTSTALFFQATFLGLAILAIIFLAWRLFHE